MNAQERHYRKLDSMEAEHQEMNQNAVRQRRIQFSEWAKKDDKLLRNFNKALSARNFEGCDELRRQIQQNWEDYRASEAPPN